MLCCCGQRTEILSACLLKSLIILLCEFGFGGVGMNFKPFESKVLS